MSRPTGPETGRTTGGVATASGRPSHHRLYPCGSCRRESAICARSRSWPCRREAAYQPFEFFEIVADRRRPESVIERVLSERAFCAVQEPRTHRRGPGPARCGHPASRAAVEVGDARPVRRGGRIQLPCPSQPVGPRPHGCVRAFRRGRVASTRRDDAAGSRQPPRRSTLSPGFTSRRSCPGHP